MKEEIEIGIAIKSQNTLIGNKRIAKNTILLYIRMMVVMAINLFAVRLIIKALGMEDYGIYNVIAGVVTSLSSLIGVLAASTQRFYSIAQGKGEFDKLKIIFSTSIRINFVIVIVLLLLAETIGLWFINKHLIIPASRLAAANWVYQSALISFASIFIQTPFSAAVIAHEDMGIFASISFLECLLKFSSAAVLLFMPFDSLIVYSLLLALTSIIIYGTYYLICRKKYLECHYTPTSDRQLRQEMLSFSGWTLLSSFAGICMYQANTILVNIFFGPLVNASRGIALQINAALSSFTASFLMAVRPPIMKYYAEDNYKGLNILFNISNKFIYYLMLIICVPLYFEMESILDIWLNQNDSQSVLFSRLIIIYSFVLALNNPISYIIQAVGQVKKYCIYVEIFTIACMPLTYILFWQGYSAAYTFVAMIVCVVLSHIVRIIFLKKSYRYFSIYEYIVNFLARGLFVSILVVIIILYAKSHIPVGISRIIIVSILTCLITILLAYQIGLSKLEKIQIKETIRNKIKRR